MVRGQGQESELPVTRTWGWAGRGQGRGILANTLGVSGALRVRVCVVSWPCGFVSVSIEYVLAISFCLKDNSVTGAWTTF